MRRTIAKSLQVAVLAFFVSLAVVGCASFWRDQSQIDNALARAKEENARAAVLEAEGQKALSEAHADGLRKAIDANTEMASIALEAALRSDRQSSFLPWLVVVAISAIAGVTTIGVVAIRQTHNTPPAYPIDYAGHYLTTQHVLRQLPGETRIQFLRRLEANQQTPLLIEGKRHD